MIRIKAFIGIITALTLVMFVLIGVKGMMMQVDGDMPMMGGCVFHGTALCPTTLVDHLTRWYEFVNVIPGSPGVLLLVLAFAMGVAFIFSSVRSAYERCLRARVRWRLLCNVIFKPYSYLQSAFSDGLLNPKVHPV